MKFLLNDIEYRVFWSYKKRKHGRTKTTCYIIPSLYEGESDEFVQVAGSSQNNID
jgi:hypothetical protein